ncbi:hypothetical protein [Aquihabitans sp. McL0605]|uniref:hypothetical protein n=1 Tax=Aquihabitans sp. McL0605 TaxID=3415671 RepID=UPI003CEF075E
MSRRPRPPLTLRAAAVIATVVAICFGVAFMVIGSSIARDSLSYLDLARDLTHGRGFGDPSYESATHFPPFTSILVAAVSVTGLSVQTSFGLVNTVALAASVLGVSALFRQAGGRRPGVALVLLLWVAAGGASTTLFSAALSEGLFMAVSIWAVVLTERWAVRASPSTAAIVWVLCAAAVATRYVGVALLIACALRLLLQPGRARRFTAALVPLSAVVPLGVWWLAYHGHQGRDPAFVAKRALSAATVFHSLGALGSWPIGIPYAENNDMVTPAIDRLIRGGLALVAIGMIAAGAWWLFRGWQRHGGALGLLVVVRDRAWLTAVLATAASVGLLVVWRFAIGYHILLRYWTPALLPAAAVGAAYVSLRLEGASPLVLRRATVVGVLLLGANLVLTLYNLAV